MRDDQPSRSALLITAPSPDDRCYDLCVTVPQLKTFQKVQAVPWVRVRANVVTEEVTLAAGIKMMRPDRYPEDDGA